MNPFTTQARDEVISVNLTGICTRLRVPSSMRTLFADLKPAHLSTPDCILKDRLDAHLLQAICAGRYADVQVTLDTLFGPRDYRPESLTTVVPTDYERVGRQP